MLVYCGVLISDNWGRCVNSWFSVMVSFSFVRGVLI